MSGRHCAVVALALGAVLFSAADALAQGGKGRTLNSAGKVTVRKVAPAGGAGAVLQTSSTYTSVAPGDANCNGVVDMADYAVWFNNYGQPGRWQDGDFDGNGIVDMNDYALWFNNYGLSSGAVGVVTNVKVMSDKNPQDVSSPAAWKKSFIAPGMTDREKAQACWRTMVMYQHQDSVPYEYLQNYDEVCDPLKMANVYGYSFCSVVAAEVAVLARYAGLEARNRGIAGHNVCELKWSNTFHMVDSSLINWFTRPDTGDLAGVSDIIGAVSTWLAANPGYKDNLTALTNYQKANGWTQWQTGGPALLASCTFYDATGWWPAKTHGWYSTMLEYDGDSNIDVEDGASMGYSVNIQLRPGEVITRNWFNSGLHVGPSTPGSLTDVNGSGDMVYCPAYGDIAPGRIGNGTHVYTVPLGDAEFRYAAWRFDNLATQGQDGRTPALHLSNTSQDGYLEIRMPSSYVYLTGNLTFNAVVAGGGQIDVKYSDNNGTSWKNVANYTSGGVKSINIKTFCFRRYDYRLRFMLRGNGTGIDTMTISHDIQHSQRPLPAMLQGDNAITFTALPQEATVTIEGSPKSGNSAFQVVYTDYSPATYNLSLYPPGYNGSGCYLTHTVSTPGDMKRVRIFSFYRARSTGDKWDIAISYDGGATWTAVGTCPSFKPNDDSKDYSKYFEVTDVPAGVRSAKVRWLGSQVNTLQMYNHRIDADYVAPYGGYRPVKITYQWKENGVDKSDVHIANTPNEVYHINCVLKPTMRSIILQLAP